MRLFGWKRPNGLRRFRRALMFVPKKNGKTTLLAAIALYGLFGDGEMSPEVYVIASKLSQGKQLWTEAVSMARRNPLMDAEAYPFESELSIKVPYTDGLFQVVSPRSVQTEDGKNVSMAILDEYHAQSNQEVLDILLHGTAARKQPLTVIISTAGENEDCPLAKEVERAKDQLSETSDSMCDTGWLTVIYEAPEGWAWDDPKTWSAANPSYGYTVYPEYYRDIVMQCDTKAKRANFERKHLNRFSAGSLKWLDVLLWDRMADPELCANDFEALRTVPCWGGLDLSSTSDFTAWALFFKISEGQYAVRVRFFLPEDNVAELQERTKRPLTDWVQDWQIETTPGNVIDYRFIREAILEDSKRFNLQETGFDPWHATQTAVELQEAGVTMVEVRQGWQTMNPVCMWTETLVGKGQIAHVGSRVMRWNIDAVRVKVGEGGEMRPQKVKREESIARIDGVVAMLTAMSRAQCAASTKTVDFKVRAL